MHQQAEPVAHRPVLSTAPVVGEIERRPLARLDSHARGERVDRVSGRGMVPVDHLGHRRVGAVDAGLVDGGERLIAKLQRRRLLGGGQPGPVDVDAAGQGIARVLEAVRVGDRPEGVVVRRVQPVAPLVERPSEGGRVGEGAPADPVAPLEDQDFASRLDQPARRRQAGSPGADDDDVPGAQWILVTRPPLTRCPARAPPRCTSPAPGTRGSIRRRCAGCRRASGATTAAPAGRAA